MNQSPTVPVQKPTVILLAASLTVACGRPRQVERAPAREVRSGEEVAETAPRPPQTTVVIHVVEAGQTLWRIARAYGLTVDELAEANGILDPTQIEVGQQLVIPGALTEVEVPINPVPTVVRGWRWPVDNGEIISSYGAWRSHGHHKGVDIRGRHGQPVKAVRAGTVTYSGSSMRGYGKTIIVNHGDGLTSLYAHNSSLLVQVGQSVDLGDPIARVGHTGNASTDHCHLEIRRHDRPLDPLTFLGEASR